MFAKFVYPHQLNTQKCNFQHETQQACRPYRNDNAKLYAS